MTYYLSALGADDSDGRSPETAWRTIARANAAVRPGDTVLLRRGDVFYGQIRPPRSTEEAVCTTYAAYGEGERPVVSQYRIILPDAWEREADGVWRVDLTDRTKFTGSTETVNTNVGFLLVTGKVYPRKKFTPDALEKQWDFYNDERFVWVKSEEHPAALAEDIRMACCVNCAVFADGVRLEDLVFTGTGAHGISGTVRHARIFRCGFHNIGGSQLMGYPTPNTRYGNGVECWSDSADVRVEDCDFSGIYDVAITMQGNNVTSGWRDMYFLRCRMWNCQQCFEIWSSGKLPGTGFINCHFEDNVCVDSGYCWGWEVRPNKMCSSHLLLYGLECPLCDVTVRGNTFSNARVAAIYKSGGPAKIPEDYRVCDNVILQPEGRDLVWRENCPDEEYRVYADRLAKENRTAVLREKEV